VHESIQEREQRESPAATAALHRSGRRSSIDPVGAQQVRIVLARHGESEANRVGEFSNRGTKHPLTDVGRAQAADLAERLAGIDVHRVLTSPLLRARQTAAIVGERLGVPVQVDERLCEFDVGAYEGSRDDAHWAEYGAVVTTWLEHGDADLRVGGGESHRELVARLGDVLHDVARGPGTSVLVGHGGLFLCGLPLLLDGVRVPWALDHPLTPTSTVEVEVHGDRLECVRWAGELPA
jgi:2,3-bisphosphoglycerate-dependent phosphoglycerate mutase